MPWLLAVGLAIVVVSVAVLGLAIDLSRAADVHDVFDDDEEEVSSDASAAG